MHKNKLFTVLLGVLLAAMLVGCGGGKEAALSPYVSEAWGITVEIPENWVAKDADDGVYVADTQEHLDADTFQEGAGIVISVSPAEEMMGMTNPMELIEFFTAFLAEGDEAMSLTQEATELTINENPAAMAKLHGTMEDQVGDYIVTVVSNDVSVAILIAVDTSTDGSFSEPLDRIIKSLTFN